MRLISRRPERRKAVRMVREPPTPAANLSGLDELLERRILESQQKREWRTFILQILCVMLAVYLLLSFVVGIAVVHGDSMEPSLHNGDIALLWRLDGSYKLGDIVYFESEGAAEILVKRVIGVPGDTVEIDDSTGSVIVNNVILSESYVYTGTHSRPGGTQYPLTLGKDEYFTLGDNRVVSKDSRSAEVGVVKRSDILGRILIYTRNAGN